MLQVPKPQVQVRVQVLKTDYQVQPKYLLWLRPTTLWGIKAPIFFYHILKRVIQF